MTGSNKFDNRSYNQWAEIIASSLGATGDELLSLAKAIENHPRVMALAIRERACPKG